MGQYCSTELNLVVGESGASHLSHYQGRYVRELRPEVDPETANPRNPGSIYYKSDHNVIWLNGNWLVGPLDTWDGSQLWKDGDIIAGTTTEAVDGFESRVARCPHNITQIQPSGEEIDIEFKWRYKAADGVFVDAQPFGLYTLPGMIP